MNNAIIIFGLIGLGLLLLFNKSKNNYLSDYSEEAELLPIKLNSGVRKAPHYTNESIALSGSKTPRNAHHYTNEETWDIEWNEDGLPKKVTIHRDAVQT